MDIKRKKRPTREEVGEVEVKNVDVEEFYGMLNSGEENVGLFS